MANIWNIGNTFPSHKSIPREWRLMPEFIEYKDIIEEQEQTALTWSDILFQARMIEMRKKDSEELKKFDTLPLDPKSFHLQKIVDALAARVLELENSEDELLKAKHNGYMEAVAAYQKELQRLDSLLTGRDSEVYVLSEDLKKTKDELRKESEKLNYVTLMHNSLVADIERCKKEATKSIEKEMKNLTEENKSLKKKYATLEKKYNTLKDEVSMRQRCIIVDDASKPRRLD